MSIYIGGPPSPKKHTVAIVGLAVAWLASASLTAWLVVEAILWIRRQP